MSVDGEQSGLVGWLQVSKYYTLLQHLHSWHLCVDPGWWMLDVGESRMENEQEVSIYNMYVA